MGLQWNSRKPNEHIYKSCGDRLFFKFIQQEAYLVISCLGLTLYIFRHWENWLDDITLHPLLGCGLGREGLEMLTWTDVWAQGRLGAGVAWTTFWRFAFPCLADSSAAGSVVAECSLAELEDGVGLKKPKPVIQKADAGEKKICASYRANSSVWGWKTVKIVPNR